MARTESSGTLPGETLWWRHPQGVSRGRSSEEARRKAGRAKGRSISKDGSTWSDPMKRETPETRRVATSAAAVDRHKDAEPVKPGRADLGGGGSRGISQRDRK